MQSADELIRFQCTITITHISVLAKGIGSTAMSTMACLIKEIVIYPPPTEVQDNRPSSFQLLLPAMKGSVLHCYRPIACR